MKSEKSTPRYLKPALDAAAKAKPGEIVHIEVHHDRGCSLLAGIGACNCRPNVHVVKPQ